MNDLRRCTLLALALGPCARREELLKLDPGAALADLQAHFAHRQRFPGWKNVNAPDALLDEMRCLRARLRTLGAEEILATDEMYPLSLGRLRGAPSVLYAWGRIPVRELVAIVGTRRARVENVRQAYRMAQELVGAGYGVVSGGAIGIDTAAHQGALANGGPTVAVLGSGLDRLYPGRNRLLFEQIALKGAVLTPFGLGIEPLRYHFPLRNRLIAALAKAVVVVEAPVRSGALSTAEWARQLRVPVLAMAHGAGALYLLRGGAGHVRSAQELLAVLKGADLPTFAAPPLEPDLQQVLAHLSSVPLAVEQLAARLSWSASRTAWALIQLELAGVARSVSGCLFIKATRAGREDQDHER